MEQFCGVFTVVAAVKQYTNLVERPLVNNTVNGSFQDLLKYGIHSTVKDII